MRRKPLPLMVRRSVPFLCAAALSFCLAADAPAQQAQTLDFSSLEAVALKDLADYKAPGAAIALVQGDQIIYLKGFGVTSIETGEPVKPETLFRPGSSTKMLTAAALVSLAVEGKLDLNAPIGNYLPDLPPKLSRITTHQLLSHTAGLYDETAPTEGSCDETALAASIKGWTDDRLFTEPGQVNSYSNPGYWLSGYLLEVVSGEPYADAMNTRLFKPLGMTRSTYRPMLAMTYPFSQGHESGPDKLPVVVRPMVDTVAQWPAGSVYTNVQDLARFVIAFLNDGKLEGKQVLDPQVIERMTASSAPYPDTKDSYGYGLQLSDTRGVHMWEHGGARLGFGSTIRMAPDYRVGVVIVANRRACSMSATAMRALELLLPLEPKKPRAEKQVAETTADDLSRHVGTYRNGAEQFQITAEEGSLYLGRGERGKRLIKRSDVRFDEEGGASIVLIPGEDGRTKYVCAGSHAYARVP